MILPSATADNCGDRRRRDDDTSSMSSCSSLETITVAASRLGPLPPAPAPAVAAAPSRSNSRSDSKSTKNNTINNNSGRRRARRRMSSSASNSRRRSLEPGTDDYEALLNINRFDVELYEYALELFVAQWATIQDRAKEHTMSYPPSLSSTGDETAAETSTKKGMFGFLRHNKAPLNQAQQDQGEASTDASVPGAAEIVETTTAVQQHGLLDAKNNDNDEDFSSAGVGSASPGSTVAEATRDLEKHAVAVSGTKTIVVQDRTSYGGDQHGLVSRQMQEAADTSIVKKGHRVVETLEMDMAQQMRKKAQLVLDQHKRRLGAGEAPPTR